MGKLVGGGLRLAILSFKVRRDDVWSGPLNKCG